MGGGRRAAPSQPLGHTPIWSLNPPRSYLQSKIHGQVQFLSTQVLRLFLLCRQTSTNHRSAREEEKMGEQRGNGGNAPVSMVCNYGQVLSVT